MSGRHPVVPPGQEASDERFRFAPAFRVGDTICVSGVIGRGDDGALPEKAADEFKLAFSRLAATLEAVGASIGDIVELASYHDDMATTLKDFVAAKDGVVEAPYPTWAAVGCTALADPGARAEVKATAVIRRGA
jgi:enamine deaminase RidA (YjgF/YER057c/UK114 family)